MSTVLVEKVLASSLSSWSGSSGRLAREFEAKVILEERPELRQPACDVVNGLSAEFPDAEIVVSVHRDPESGYQSLMIRALIGQYGRDARAKLREFVRDRWPESAAEYRNDVFVMVAGR